MNYKENKISYEELVQLHQEGKINWLEFIEAQETLLINYREWLDESELDANNDTAEEYLSYLEKMIMNCQTVN